jgi:3-deoxy-D-manno-octulosonate 8-phosphate phosphatase (KDO 8-P phosphatase)
MDPLAARKVRLVVLDVDGVLTDNEIYVGLVAGERVEFKRFNVQDGVGVHLLRTARIPVALLSGRVSEATRLRAAELGIEEVIQDPDARKVPAMKELLARRGLQWNEVLFAGDDLADVPPMRRAGLPCSVANGVAQAKEAASYVTAARGGHGAVRELAESLLRARGEWEATLDQYYRERGGHAD